MRILVAEDDAVSRKILTRILSEEGHDTVIAHDGKQAFDLFCADPLPIVISDWMMPELDGLALCRKIRDMRLPDYTHFVMLTAKTGLDNYRMAMAEGVDDFLSKPVNREALVIKLRVAERVMTQRREAEKIIRALARFPEDNPNPILQVDQSGCIQYANRACQALMEEWRKRPGDRLPEKLESLVQLNPMGGPKLETEIVCGDQVYSFAVTSIYNGDRTYLYGHNITDRKRAENELVAMKNQAVEASLHDQLTGLPNRILLQDRLAHAMARCRRQGTKLALVVIDIDNFKTINDSQGHQVGDRVLVLVGQCLQNQVRKTDTLCRWGGDELILLLPDLTEASCVPGICDKIAAALAQQLVQEELNVPVTLSMGFSMFPEDTDQPDVLLQQADHALYTAKAEGRNCWRKFSGFGQGAETKGLADLYLRLSEAVRQSRIQVHFQPIMDAFTGKLAGMEALARWKDDRDGWVSPDVFITMAEERGLILTLGQQVASSALRQLRDLRQAGAVPSVSINLSKTQLLDPGFLPWMLDSVRQLELDPSWVILEVTERQSLLAHGSSRRCLEELAAAGFRLSLDDFGTGYASLDMVGEMPFHELKIPRALIRKLESPKGRRIVQAIVEMARTLDLKIVAEGVETPFMHRVLREIQVHKLQGFLFSKPLAGADMASYVQRLETESPAFEVLQAQSDLTMLEPRERPPKKRLAA